MNYATTNGSCILYEDISSSPRLDGIRTLNYPSTSFSLAPRIILQPQSSQSSLLLSSRAEQPSAGTQSTRETMGSVVMAMKSMGVIGRQSTELQLVNYRENIKNTHTHTHRRKRESGWPLKTVAFIHSAFFLVLYIDQHQGLLVPLWLWSKSASYGQIVIPQKTVLSTLKGTQSQAASAVPPPKHRPTASELQIVLCFSHSFHVSLFLDLWHPAEDLDLVLDTEEPGSGSWHWGTCFSSSVFGQTIQQTQL